VIVVKNLEKHTHKNSISGLQQSNRMGESSSGSSSSSDSGNSSSSDTSDDSRSESGLESDEESPKKPSAVEPVVVEPATIETVVVNPAGAAEIQEEEQVQEMEFSESEDEELYWFVSVAEDTAEKLNPYPKILGPQPEIEEDYVCKEPDIVTVVRSLIIRNYASRDGDLKRAISELLSELPCNNTTWTLTICDNALADAVTGITVSSEWGPRIKKAAQADFGEGAVTPEGIVLNEKLPLILVKPIHFANLRANDMHTVSILYVCHLNVDVLTVFLCSFNRCLPHMKFVKYSTMLSELVLTSLGQIFHIFTRLLNLPRDM
jgi:hypothetical protein